MRIKCIIKSNNIIIQTENKKQGSKVCSNYPETGVCLARAAMESLALTREGEGLMVGLGRGVLEFLVTGDIRDTWRQLRTQWCPVCTNMANAIHDERLF